MEFEFEEEWSLINKKKIISNLIYFLTSDEAKFINGEIIKIDGGSHV